MAMQSRHNMTYMLFTKKGKGIGKLVGPVFEKEIGKTKEIYFNTDNVQIVEENAFKVRYSKRYIAHIKDHWCDKVYCYLLNNIDWVGQIYSVPNQKMFCNDWFTIFEHVHENELISLELRFSINSSPFYSARMLYDLKKILPVVITEGKRYFRAKDGQIYNGTRGLSRYLGEQLIENMCLV